MQKNKNVLLPKFSNCLLKILKPCVHLQKDINKENESLKDVNAMNRKEISNVKSLHP